MSHDLSIVSAGPPIFILGITPRSGTNFVSHLLRLHPDCQAPPIWEDYFLHHAELLVRYVHAVDPRRRWSPADRDPAEPLEDHMLRCLGHGVLAFATSLIGDARLVTKTPSIRNLRSFFRLFPEAYLLIVVRDGRAVTESRAKSFDVNYEMAMRDWASAAREILEFDRAVKSSTGKYCIVRYEDLWRDLHQELSRLFAFLGLDGRRYDFAAAAELPVRGSSELRSERGQVHWQPMQKTRDFDPTRRWAHWTRFQRQRFDWLAGKYMRQFGYADQEYVPCRVVDALANSALDALWPVRCALLPIPRGLRRVRGLWRSLDDEGARSFARKCRRVYRGITRRVRESTSQWLPRRGS